MKLQIIIMLTCSINLMMPLYAMEEDASRKRPHEESGLEIQPAAQRARLTPSDEAELAYVADIERDLQIQFVEEFRYAITNNSLIRIQETIKANDPVAQLTPAERKELYELACTRFNIWLEHTKATNAIIDRMTDRSQIEALRQTQGDLSAQGIVKICKALRVFSNFSFPQVHFSRPFAGNPPLSLDQLLEALIVNEKQSIKACCFHLTLFNLARAMVEAKHAMIDIEIVTNHTQGTNVPLEALNYIISQGILVLAPQNSKWETNHHKFFLFQSNITGTRLLLNGSYNPTGHSNENSWENVMILDDQTLIEAFITQFNQIKAASKQITLDQLKKISSHPSAHSLAKNNVPTGHFTPEGAFIPTK